VICRPDRREAQLAGSPGSPGGKRKPGHTAGIEQEDLMTTDLWMLVYTALLCVLIPNVAIFGLSREPGGLPWGFGNRDTPFPVPTWVERARRAHANMVENLAPFACLVLVAHVAGKANATTALGAQIFFIARVAHAGIYIAGIPYLRTAAFTVGSVAELMILVQIFK
jgi:uncharacterized MAPEG superfamily protein